MEGQYKTNNDSLSKRYIFKVGSSFISIPFNIVINMLAPRILGPSAYGSFSFITDFFQKVIAFIESSSSIFIFNKISRNQKDINLIPFYLIVSLIISVILLLLTLIIILTDNSSLLWPEQNIHIVWLGLSLALLSWYSQLFVKFVDAHSLTVKGEVYKVVQKVFLCALLANIYIYNINNLTAFFICNILSVVIYCLCMIKVLKKSNIGINFKILKDKFIGLSQEMYYYIKPLILYGFIALVTMLLDRWILQNYFGSVEQGYFGLANKICTLCFIFTGAIIPLLMREFSRSLESKDEKKLISDYKKYIPRFLYLSSYFCIFISSQSEVITSIFGGYKFTDAIIFVSLMVILPIHQTYGQINTSLLYANGKTKLISKIGIFGMLFGLILSYFLILPDNFGGKNLGGIGLAIKMLFIQFMTVNIQVWYIAKFLKLNFISLIKEEISIITLVSIFSLLSFYITTSFNINIYIKLIITGFIYTSFNLIFILLYPSIIKTKRSIIYNHIYKHIRKVFSFKR